MREMLAVLATSAAIAASPVIATAPVLSPSQPWEQTAVYEPSVIHDSSGWRMWYTGGWAASGIGYATSPDGVTWTKYAGNPVIHSAARGNVIRVGNQLWCYWADGYGAAHDSIHRSVSHDGVHWRDNHVALAPPAWASAVANSTVAYTDTHWVMLFDARVGDSWQLGVAYSTDGVTFLDSGAPLNGGLGVAPTYGSPDLVRVADGWRLYFLAGGTVADPFLPTDIYVSDSADLATWTAPRLLVGRTLPWEVDQVADPFYVAGRLYFAGMDNQHAAGVIGMVTL